MANIDASMGNLAGAAAIAGSVLPLFGAPIAIADEQLVAPYYLTVRLVESHLPSKATRRGGILEQVFGDDHTTATTQIEFDVDADKPYRSTTVAHALERRQRSWVSRSLTGTNGRIGDHRLSDYEIASNRRLHRGDSVTLGVTYSATHQSIDTMRLFFESVEEESLKIAPFTYSGLASKALRLFARSRSSKNQLSHTMRRNAGDIQKLVQKRDCVILSLNPLDGRRDLSSPGVVDWVSCEDETELSSGPYVKLHLSVSRSRFDLNEEENLKPDLDSYIAQNLRDWQKLFVRPVDKEKLNRDCEDLRRVLDLDLVPYDRNLIILAFLHSMGFDPHAERPVSCWEDQKDVLGKLVQKYPSLRLGACARNNPARRQECEFVNEFMLHWRDVGTHNGAGGLSWEIRHRGRNDEGKGSLDDLRKQYELDLRYGDFKYILGEWRGAGSVRDKTGGKDCLFAAQVRIAVDGDRDDGGFVVYKVIVEADPDAEVRKYSVKKSKNWQNTAECEAAT